MPKRLTPARRLQMLKIIDAINSEDFAKAQKLADEAPEWFMDWPLWSAGENMPGYMPDSPFCLMLTERAAIGYCRELEREDGHREGGYTTDIIPTTLRDQLPE